MKSSAKKNSAARRRARELVAREALVKGVRSGIGGLFDFEGLEDAEDAEWQAVVFNYAHFHGIHSDLGRVQKLVKSSAGISGLALARPGPGLVPRSGL